MNELVKALPESFKEKKHELKDVWDFLEELKSHLHNLNLAVNDRLFRQEIFLSDTAVAGVPIVRDGLDGARVSFKKTSFERHGIENDGFYALSLWFTNGLENPNNEIRQKIQATWDDLMKKYFINS